MPTTNPSEEIKKALEDIYGKLFSQYQSREQRFERLFTALIITSLFFLFVFLIPYVAIQHENKYYINRLVQGDEDNIAQSLSINASLTSREAYNQLLHSILTSPLYLVEFSKSLNKTSDIATSSFDPCIKYGDFGQNFDLVAECMMEREINTLFNNYTMNFPKIVNPLFSIYSDSKQIEHLFNSLNLTADEFIHNQSYYVDAKSDLPPIVNFLASDYSSGKIYLIEGKDPASYALYKIFEEINLGQQA